MQPRRLVRLLLLCAVLALAACGKPDVSGSVLPAEPEGHSVPWQRVEMRLISGTLKEQLAPLAAEHRQSAIAEAQQRVLAAAKAERAAKADAAERTRAALAENGGVWVRYGEAATPIRACLPMAETRLVAARQDYRAAVAALAPRIAAVGVATDSVDRTIAQLRTAVQAKIDGEARRMRDDYLRTQLVQQSRTVLAARGALDRLCWSVVNKRNVAVRFRGLTVLYNGRVLPDSVAQQIWRLPPPGAPLHIPNNGGGGDDVLLPGAQFEACFYSQGRPLSLQIVERYGFSTYGPARAGEWRVLWRDIELVDEGVAAAGQRVPHQRRPPEPAPLTTMFADDLRALQLDSEEARLLSALTDSDTFRALQHAEAVLLACHRAIEAERASQEGARVIQAIEAGQTGDLAVQTRLHPVVQRLIRERSRLSKWIDEAGALMDSRTIARQEREPGQPYRFEDLEPGRYTLLAHSMTDAAKPKLWLIPLEVDGHVAQDLVATTARDLPLRETLEHVLLGEGG